jgi:hypothetical protein
MSSMSTTPPPDHCRRDRPSELTDPAIDEILAGLCEGKSLREICEAEHLPSRSTVFRRLHRDPAFQAAYAAARATGAEAMCDEVIELGRNATSENAAGIRVRVDTVKWAAARLAPKRWGDKIAAEVSGPDGKPLQLQPVQVSMVPAQVAAGIKALLTRSEAAANLPSGDGKPDEERLQAVLSSGAPIDPDLYDALYTDTDKE